MGEESEREGEGECRRLKVFVVQLCFWVLLLQASKQALIMTTPNVCVCVCTSNTLPSNFPSFLCNKTRPKSVLPTPRPIRPSQTKAMENIDTAADLIHIITGSGQTWNPPFFLGGGGARAWNRVEIQVANLEIPRHSETGQKVRTESRFSMITKSHKSVRRTYHWESTSEFEKLSKILATNLKIKLKSSVLFLLQFVLKFLQIFFWFCEKKEKCLWDRACVCVCVCACVCACVCERERKS